MRSIPGTLDETTTPQERSMHKIPNSLLISPLWMVFEEDNVTVTSTSLVTDKKILISRGEEGREGVGTILYQTIIDHIFHIQHLLVIFKFFVLRKFKKNQRDDVSCLPENQRKNSSTHHTNNINLDVVAILNLVSALPCSIVRHVSRNHPVVFPFLFHGFHLVTIHLHTIHHHSKSFYLYLETHS